MLETINFKRKKKIISEVRIHGGEVTIWGEVTHHRRVADDRAKNRKMRNPLARCALTDLKPSSIKEPGILPSNPQDFGGHLRMKLKDI